MKQSLILFICFIYCAKSYSQVGITPRNTAFFQTAKTHYYILTKVEKNRNERIMLSQNTLAPIPSAYCYQNLAFFCKVEVKLEKFSTFPIKFRLGSVPYVDSLEQK